MEGSGSFRIITDPVAGGPKTYVRILLTLILQARIRNTDLHRKFSMFQEYTAFLQTSHEYIIKSPKEYFMIIFFCK